MTLFLAAALVTAQPNFSTQKYDLHLMAGAGVGITQEFLFHRSDRLLDAAFWGAASSLGAGLAKEGLDMGRNKRMDPKDVLWTVLGGTVSATVLHLIRGTKKNKKKSALTAKTR